MLIVLMSSAFSQISEDGLIGYWSFDGDYEDYSGYLNHGIPEGTTLVTDRFGNESSAVEFNGIDDYIRVPHHASYSLDANSDNFTISLWYWTLEPSLFSGVARFVDKWNGNPSNVYSHNIIIVDNMIKSSLYDANLTSQPYSPLNLGGRWTNLIVINDVENDVSKIFSNGILQDEVENTSTTSTDNNFDMLFGTDYTKIRDYHGKMDEIRIYNRVLSQEEIDEIVNEVVVSLDFIPANSDITVYPNPFTSKISIGSNSTIEKVEVFNSFECILKIDHSGEVDLSELDSGAYFLRIKTNLGTSVSKLIKCNN